MYDPAHCKYATRHKVCLKHYSPGSLSRGLTSVIRLSVARKAGESLSLSSWVLGSLSRNGSALASGHGDLGVKPGVCMWGTVARAPLQQVAFSLEEELGEHLMLCLRAADTGT